MDLKRVYNIGAGFVLGGLVASGVAGAVIRLPDFDDSGNIVKSKTYAHSVPLNINVTSSGGVAADDAFLVTNPISAEQTGSGTTAGSGVLMSLIYENIANPSATSHDICFVEAARTGSGTHACPLENTCTATGCVSAVTLTTANLATMLWNGDVKLAGKTLDTINTSFRARVRLEYHDIAGE